MAKKHAIHPNHLAKYAENAHAKQNRELRQQVASLQQQMAQMELDAKVQTSEKKLVQAENKRAKPFLDSQGAGKKKATKKSGT